MLQLKLIASQRNGVSNGSASTGHVGAPVLTASSFTKERKDHYKGLIEAEEHLVLEAIAFDFDALDHLPYGAIRVFCETNANFASREHLHTIAQAFCNDSFKLPLSLMYHPKVIAAACVQSAMVYRVQHGCNSGVEKLINGHAWYKWIDSAIEFSDILEVVNRMKILYAKAPTTVASG
jgi:hypothetical protein